MSTTNGTRALDRVRTAPPLFTAALVNRSAVAQRLLQHRPEQIWMVGSGWEGAYSWKTAWRPVRWRQPCSRAAGSACLNWPATMKPAQPMPCGSNGRSSPKRYCGWPAMASACSDWGITTRIWLAAPRSIASRWFLANRNRVFCG